MPRFGTKSLLLGFLVVSLWLSTLSGYEAAADVHKSLLLLATISAGVAVVYGKARWRAFAIAFFAVMFFASDFFTSYNLRFDYLAVLSNSWSAAIATDENHRHFLNLAFLWSLISTWTLALATIAGAVGALIYEHFRGQPAVGDRTLD